MRALLFALIGLICLPARAIDVQEVYTSGGLEAWLVQDETLPFITISVEFRGGAASDPAGKEGLANMTAALLDEGSGDLPSLAFQKALQDQAIEMGFSASRDHLRASMRTLLPHAEDAFELFGEALANPRFDEEAVERTRRQILTGIVRDQDDPNAIAAQTWLAQVFGAHPYGDPTDGTLESVQSITQADLKRFARARIALDNMIIAIVGNVSMDDASDLLDLAFNRLPEEADAPMVGPARPSFDGHFEVVPLGRPQSTVFFGLNGLRRTAPDWYTAQVLNYVIGGGGFASRLMEEVREKRGLTYGIGTALQPYEHGGVWFGRVSTENDRVSETVSVIRMVMQDVADNGLTDDELSAAKTYLTGSYPLSFTSAGQIAEQLLGIQRYGLGLDYVDKRNSYIEAVRLPQVQQLAKRMIDVQDVVWIVVGQPEGLEMGLDTGQEP